ncbi:hypothetical protein JI664_16210 [Rhodobacter sp. NTK016B]|uniref:hypothetical protein n=1 Tax=Rhodobacter sp. NTK016B TaxID=2759676 RepID=UPI001A9040AC|nr:hypothetical protein [Rhodobacter sp. NTK016B]MBN8293517.1 hypothetical protein [Rhodobacter sp. NTK016B]
MTREHGLTYGKHGNKLKGAVEGAQADERAARTALGHAEGKLSARRSPAEHVFMTL